LFFLKERKYWRDFVAGYNWAASKNLRFFKIKNNKYVIIFLQQYLLPLKIIQGFSHQGEFVFVYLHQNQKLAFGMKLFHGKKRKLGVSQRYFDFLNQTTIPGIRDMYFVRSPLYGILPLEECFLKKCSGEVFLIVFFRDTTNTL
jgi:hypothetical protein